MLFGAKLLNDVWKEIFDCFSFWFSWNNESIILNWCVCYLYEIDVPSGLVKCNTVLSSLKKLISSTPNCWAPIFLTRFLTTLSLDPFHNRNAYLCFCDYFDFSSLGPFSSCSGVTHLFFEFSDVLWDFLLWKFHDQSKWKIIINEKKMKKSCVYSGGLVYNLKKIYNPNGRKYSWSKSKLNCCITRSPDKLVNKKSYSYSW